LSNKKFGCLGPKQRPMTVEGLTKPHPELVEG
jgi:hypothetical protein